MKRLGRRQDCEGEEGVTTEPVSTQERSQSTGSIVGVLWQAAHRLSRDIVRLRQEAIGNPPCERRRGKRGKAIGEDTEAGYTVDPKAMCCKSSCLCPNCRAGLTAADSLEVDACFGEQR